MGFLYSRAHTHTNRHTHIHCMVVKFVRVSKHSCKFHKKIERDVLYTVMCWNFFSILNSIKVLNIIFDRARESSNWPYSSSNHICKSHIVSIVAFQYSGRALLQTFESLRVEMQTKKYKFSNSLWAYIYLYVLFYKRVNVRKKHIFKKNTRENKMKIPSSETTHEVFLEFSYKTVRL